MRGHGVSKFKITDEMIIPYEQRPQEFMGVAVIQRQPGLAPHPHPSQGGRLVETRGVTHVLLANDHEFYECAVRNCTKQSQSAGSIVAHLSAHNPANSEPNYDVATIRAVLRVAAEEREVGFKNYAVRAADRLNAMLNVERLDKKPWSPESVSRMWARHHEKYGPQRVRRQQVRRTVPVAASVEPPKRDTPTTTPFSAKPGIIKTRSASATPVPTVASLEARGARLFHHIDDQKQRLERIADSLTEFLAAAQALVNDCGQRDELDEETVRKAKQFDRLMGALGDD